MESVETPYQKTPEEVVESLGVTPDAGLSDAEAKTRLREFGPNQLEEREAKSPWTILFDQIKSLVVILLIGAAILSIFLGDWTEAGAIIAVIAINTVIGFATEFKANKSMEALHRMGTVDTRVRRGGDVKKVPATKLVPGDIVLLEGGEVISADARLLKASKLQANEASLTGESVPVAKDTEALAEDHPLAERNNMVYKGTAVTRGSGEAVVTGTGMDTQLGAISELVAEAESESTPLEKRLDALGQTLVWVVLGIAALVIGAGILQGKDWFLMVKTGIALAVASIPEGLPVVATIALSRGMMRMANRQALVSKLASVETLGSTTVICSDKTGTLTENKMSVGSLRLADGVIRRDEQGHFTRDSEPIDPKADTLLYEALMIGVLCNSATVQRDEQGTEQWLGDPLEVALREAGQANGLDRDELIENYPETRQEAFETDTMMMATFHETKDGFYVAVKGAPEAVLDVCNRVLTVDDETNLDEQGKNEWLEQNEELAAEGYRVVAVARKTVDSGDAEPYSDLTMIGLVGLVDPPREDIRPTIDSCRTAGIKVVMVTGDHKSTALNVARGVGIVDDDDSAAAVLGSDLRAPEELSEKEEEKLVNATVFARVNPRQKLDLINLHQRREAIVAMTGDGVNDAPALKKADIGVAMGRRGTQVAQQVADVVLKDDSFKTIVYAIKEGRIIFGNIRKVVLSLISSNISEVLVIFIASMANMPLPLLPLQILFINLVTDVFPALALGVGEGDESVMRQKPRRTGEAILTGRHWAEMVLYGLVITAATLTVFLLALWYYELGETAAVTIAFMTLAFSQLWHVYDMRSSGSNLLNNDVTRNPFVWGALSLCSGLLLLAVYLPGLSTVLETEALSLQHWALIIPFSLAPVALDLALRTFYRIAPR